MKKWLLLLLFLPCLAFGDEFSVKDLSGGLYSNPSANRIPDNAATTLENFYTDVEQLAVERNGSEKRDTTVLGGTKAVTGLWEFVDNTGQQWIISFSSKTYYKNVVGVAPSVFGSVPTATTIPDCAVNLGKIWCVNGTDSMWWFDGTSTGTVATAPLGTLIEPWRNRLIIGNISGSQSTFRVSGDGDGTDWTIAGQSTSPFSGQVGGANDGFNITSMWKSYQDNFVIARKKDIWYLSGFSQDDWELRNVSAEIGCIQQGSMREFDGSLLFLSNRGMEELRGYTITHISEPVRNITDQLVKNTANSRSAIYTTQSDFINGSISPSGYASLTAIPGSVVLSTSNAISSVDTSSGDFQSGTVNNSTVTRGGSITLPLASTTIKISSTDVSQAGSPGCQIGDIEIWQARGFKSTETYITTGVELGVSVIAGGGDSNDLYTMFLLSDNSGAPDIVLTSATTTGDGFSGGTGSVGSIFTWITPYTLISGTTYWIKAQADNCQTGAGILWNTKTVSQSTFHTYTHSNQSTSQSTNFENVFGIRGGLYSTSIGTFTSQAKNIGFSTNTWMWNWGAFQPTGSLPVGTTISYQIRTSSDGTNWNSFTAVSSGSLIPSTVQQYVSYRATFTTTINTVAPIVNDVTIFTSSLTRPSGVYTSSAISVGSLVGAWGPLTIADATNGGTINYQFNSSTNSDINLFISTNWATITSGGVPSNTVAPYVAFRSSFNVTGGTQAPRLDSFTIQWAEGGTTQPLTSWIYDRRYWLSFTTNTLSGSYNDRILVYQRNRTWTMITGINAASFATWRDGFYFGNSISNGYVYHFDVGNDDDGNPIISQIITKSYDLGAFKNNKDLESLYVNFLGNSSFSGSFDLSYDLDRSGANYSLGSSNMSEGTGQVAAKFPFSLSNPVQGREIQYKIVKNGTGDRLKLYELGTVFTLMEAQ